MRRSKAPSVLHKEKRAGPNENHLDPEEEYDWGSRNLKSRKHKRIFSVLWREVSNRKHKIWKGDGSLEVDNHQLKAVLKDETGKLIGSSAKVDVNGLVPDFQMIISGKEVEIQNEIDDDEKLQNLREMQADNFKNNVQDMLEEAKKPKGGFKFKPILVLKPPKLTNDENLEHHNLEWRASELQNQYAFIKDNNSANPELCNEFMCFLKPSELQQILFQRTLEFLSLRKFGNVKSLEVELVLKMICNHPSLINHKTTANELLRHLIPDLPDWAEMGPFDSAKLEFVQYFLADLIRSNQNCIILAINLNAINMLQGLCDFMNVRCLRIINGVQESEALIRSSDDGSTDVILANSLEILSYTKLSNFYKKIIVFEEYLKFSNICSLENFKDLTVYYLITAFSIEELFLIDAHKNTENLLCDLADMNVESDCCYLHSKIDCKCFESVDKHLNIENLFIKYWNHFKSPLDLQLLKVSSLENSSENIVSIFSKKT